MIIAEASKVPEIAALATQIWELTDDTQCPLPYVDSNAGRFPIRAGAWREPKTN